MERPGRKFNLDEIYAHETTLARYVRLTVGEGAGIYSLLWHEMVLGLLGGFPGLLGLGLRNLIYPSVFRGLSRKAFLGRHVTLRCPRQIHLSEQVVVDEFVQLVATSRHPQAIRIGRASFLRSFASVNAGPPEGYVHIGEESGVGQGTILYGNGGLSIGNHVMIAGQCFIVASSHHHETSEVPIKSQGFSARGIVIDDNVWIGAGAKILDGVTIGKGAIVGANAVVTRSVPPGTKVAGVPARAIDESTPGSD